MNCSNLSENPKKFPAMTGYAVKEFENLFPHFKRMSEEELRTKTLTGKPRMQRQHVAYKNSPLPSIEDNLLFILVYLKTGTTQETFATLFGMHQPDANKRIHFLHPILNRALKEIGELPVRDAALLNFDDEKKKNFLQDGTERPIVRPKNKEEQKLFHSGKKKGHAVKNILLINVLCRIVFLSGTCEGKKHDKKAADEAGYGEKFPKGSRLGQDTGFQGFDGGDAEIIQPVKKPKGRNLTEEEKAGNKKVSGIRIRIEHAISGVKRYRIIKDKIRNWGKGFRDMVMETCCGLHNFRLRFRPWTEVVFV